MWEHRVLNKQIKKQINKETKNNRQAKRLLEEEILKYGTKAKNLRANILKRYNAKNLMSLTNEQINDALETLKNFKKAG